MENNSPGQKSGSNGLGRRDASGKANAANHRGDPGACYSDGAILQHPQASEAVLYQDALQSAATLKQKHAAFYAADPKGFSRIVRKANAAALRRKPGPAPDPRIMQAAVEHAGGGAKWPDLYPKYIVGYGKLKELSPATCDDAEAGFRRKVYDYEQRDPRLKAARKGRRKSGRKGHRKYNTQLRPPDPQA
jgi:hypothetical protein